MPATHATIKLLRKRRETMTDKHTPKRRTCDDCNPLWDRKLNVKAIQLCPLHAAAPKLLEALEGLREDLQTRLDASSEGATEASGLVDGEAANRSWHSWLFDVMSTHGDIARAAIEAAKGDA
jgi:hypothetical protein